MRARNPAVIVLTKPRRAVEVSQRKWVKTMKNRATIRASILYLIVPLVPALSAAGGPEVPIQDAAPPQQVILDARVLTVDEIDLSPLGDDPDLLEVQRQLLTRYCCWHSNTEESFSAPWVKYEPENAYFVQAKISFDALARVTEATRCRRLSEPRRCSDAELAQRVAAVGELGRKKDVDAYYDGLRDSWSFAESGSELPRTARYGYHHLIWVRRDKLRRTDEVLLGPLPIQPDEMIIRLQGLSANDRQDVTDPRTIVRVSGTRADYTKR